MPILACSTSFLLSLGVLGLLGESLESAAGPAQPTGNPGAELAAAPATWGPLIRPSARPYLRARRPCLVALRPVRPAAGQVPGHANAASLPLFPTSPSLLNSLKK